MSENISHHIINEETQFKVNQERHEAKKRKFRPKTKIQRLKSVFYILTVVWVVCQGISALLASTGFYHFAASNLNGNSFLIGSLVFMFCLGLEVSFNTVVKLIAKQKYDDKTSVSKVLFFMVAFLGLFYAGSTFFGTPYAVQFLAASPSYFDIEGIESKHNELIKKDTSYYNLQVFMAQSSADAFLMSHGKRDCKDSEKCPWRIRSADRKAHNVLLGKVDSVGALASISFVSLNVDRKTELKEAEEGNTVMKADHLAWCGSFGWGLSFVSLGCIVIFLIAFDWCQAYERKELNDNDSILSEHKKAEAKVKAQEKAEIEKLKAEAPKVEGKGKGEGNPKVVVNEPSIPIGFATASIKEGDIEKGEGRKSDRVYVEVKGELRAMTFGELNTLIRGQSTEGRITHLESLKRKLA